MPASRTARRAGRLATGLGALVILVGLLVGAPVALLTLAGNPLPDHVPTLGEIGTVLTSRDDGQLFLRVLALAGWVGWATFALSVLVEVAAKILRRPAIRLPGLSRQQRWAAALVGSVVLALAASPAAAVTGAVTGSTLAAAVPASPVGASPVPAAAAPSDAPPATVLSGTAVAASGATPSGPAPHWLTAPPSGPAPHWLAEPDPPAGRTERPEPVYRVEKDDYLGHIADRYLGDFDRYPELARLNKIRNPDRIHPGQLLRLPESAEDRGVREHATGLVATPPPPGGQPDVTQRGGGTPPNAGHPERTRPVPRPPVDTPRPDHQQPSAPAPSADAVPTPVPSTGAVSGPHPGTGGDGRTTYAAGAAPEPATDRVNRPLAVSAVIAVASVVGAQLGTVLGLRGRRPAATSGRHRLRD